MLTLPFLFVSSTLVWLIERTELLQQEGNKQNRFLICWHLCYFPGPGKIRISTHSFLSSLQSKCGHSLYRLCQLISQETKSCFEPSCKTNIHFHRKKVFIFSSIWFSPSHSMQKISFSKDTQGASFCEHSDHTGIKRSAWRWLTISPFLCLYQE